MSSIDMVARLSAQAADEGADMVTVRAMVEEASELGAERALHRLGLADANAHSDVFALRELLRAWRDAKASVWKEGVSWMFRGVLALLLLGMAWRAGAMELLK